MMTWAAAPVSTARSFTARGTTPAPAGRFATRAATAVVAIAAAARTRTTSWARSTTTTWSTLRGLEWKVVATLVAVSRAVPEIACDQTSVLAGRGSHVVLCLWVETAGWSQRRMSLALGWFHGPAG
jgi:hypothetical protein